MNLYAYIRTDTQLRDSVTASRTFICTLSSKGVTEALHYIKCGKARVLEVIGKGALWKTISLFGRFWILQANP